MRPSIAIVNADVPPRAISDGSLTGCDEIGLAFGEALAPNSDGVAKPIAVEGRLDPGRGKCWRSVGRAPARCHVGHDRISLKARSPGLHQRAGVDASLCGGGSL